LVSLRTVDKKNINLVWPDVNGFILKALKYSDGKYNLSDIKEGIESGRMQLFIAVDNFPIAAAVTEITDFPQKRVLSITLVGGERMEEWLHLMNQLEAWAKDAGCEQIELFGRPGWEKVLGWDKTYTALKKDLN